MTEECGSCRARAYEIRSFSVFSTADQSTIMDDVRNDQKDSLRSVLLRRWRWFTRLLKLAFVCFVMYQAPRLTTSKGCPRLAAKKSI